MSDAATCKRSLEFTVPAAEIEAETARVVLDLQKKMKLPGFRPGKTPLPILRTRYANEIKKQVVDDLLPKVFTRKAREENLHVIGTPAVDHLHFHEDGSLHFTAEFEVAPEFELGEYVGLEVPYQEPAASDEDITARLNNLREQKAEYVNIDPRPVENGDYAVVAMLSTEGVEGAPVQSDEMVLLIGDPDTMPEFSQHLLGANPGEEKDIEVSYPENYAHEQLSGRKVKFHVTLKGIRRKDMPEANDEFAADMGDFKSIDELREEIRRGILREQEAMHRREAQEKLINRLVESHDFPVPAFWVERQVETNLETRVRELAMQGIDPSKLKIDWEELKKSQPQQDRAAKDVKASLILGKIAEREKIDTLMDEIDREVHRFAKQVREPAAAVRMRMEKDGSLGRLATRIRTDKVLNFLFEQARKVAVEAEPKAEVPE